jgi:hypothetical protein
LGDSWTDIDILDDDVKDTLTDIVQDRWNFIHTESMGFAYLLSPQSLKKQWAANDKAATKGQLKQYISVFYEGNDEAIERCRGELDTDFTNMVNLPYVLEEFLSLSGKQLLRKKMSDSDDNEASVKQPTNIILVDDSKEEETLAFWNHCRKTIKLVVKGAKKEQ